MPDLKNMSMAQDKSKHIRSFWPVVLILVITVVLGGFILYFANSNIVDDEVSSSTFAPIHFFKKMTGKTQSQTAKPAVKSGSGTASTTTK